jgi:hypothetical protein
VAVPNFLPAITVSLVSSTMSSVYAARAKKWETNSFVAEWFSNAVAYCQTKEGKKAFEAWWVLLAVATQSAV